MTDVILEQTEVSYASTQVDIYLGSSSTPVYANPIISGQSYFFGLPLSLYDIYSRCQSIPRPYFSAPNLFGFAQCNSVYGLAIPAPSSVYNKLVFCPPLAEHIFFGSAKLRITLRPESIRAITINNAYSPSSVSRELPSIIHDITRYGPPVTLLKFSQASIVSAKLSKCYARKDILLNANTLLREANYGTSLAFYYSGVQHTYSRLNHVISGISVGIAYSIKHGFCYFGSLRSGHIPLPILNSSVAHQPIYNNAHISGALAISALIYSGFLALKVDKATVELGCRFEPFIKTKVRNPSAVRKCKVRGTAYGFKEPVWFGVTRILQCK